MHLFITKKKNYNENIKNPLKTSEINFFFKDTLIILLFRQKKKKKKDKRSGMLDFFVAF